jgi:hypothetical protein
MTGTITAAGGGAVGGAVGRLVQATVMDATPRQISRFREIDRRVMVE